jgi:hypothetical protein
VLASFDKQHETLIANNPDATEERNYVRTELVKIGQLIQTSPPPNGNGIIWKRLVDKAENEKNVLCKHLDGKALFTGMMRLYAAIHRDLEDSLLPECAKGSEEDVPRSKRRKRNGDSDDGSSTNKREATDKFRPLPVYQSGGQWQPRISSLRSGPYTWRVRKQVKKDNLQTILTKVDHLP